jgi:hypothetical protein
MALSNAQKEKIKLRATFFNGVAMGIVLIGAFTPITRAAYDSTIRSDALGFMAGLTVVCFVLGFVLHLHAMRHLEGLDG